MIIERGTPGDGRATEPEGGNPIGDPGPQPQGGSRGSCNGASEAFCASAPQPHSGARRSPRRTPQPSLRAPPSGANKPGPNHDDRHRVYRRLVRRASWATSPALLPTPSADPKQARDLRREHDRAVASWVGPAVLRPPKRWPLFVEGGTMASEPPTLGANAATGVAASRAALLLVRSNHLVERPSR